MADPRNYMKAVDALVAKYGAIQLTLTHNGVGIAIPGFGHHGKFEKIAGPKLSREHFYDSEHAKAHGLAGD